MGNLFAYIQRKYGNNISLTIKLPYFQVKNIIYTINQEYMTDFKFILYDNFYNGTNNNEVLLDNSNKHVHLDIYENRILDIIQHEIKNFILLQHTYHFNTYLYFGGIFIYIEKYE
jgi:hypothetical protein